MKQEFFFPRIFPDSIKSKRLKMIAGMKLFQVDSCQIYIHSYRNYA